MWRRVHKLVGKSLSISLAVLVISFFLATPVFAGCYSYHDSFVSHTGCTNGTFFDGGGNNYWHTGYTWGSQYPGNPLSSVRVHVSSYDVADGNTCNIRVTDSGNMYGVFSTGNWSTSPASVTTCTGQQYHNYYANGTHWFASLVRYSSVSS